VPHSGQQTGVIVLGSDFKALAAVRSLGRRGIPIVLMDSLPRSAWFSRLVEARCSWSGPLVGEAFLNRLEQIGDEKGLEGWMLFPMQDDATESVSAAHERLSRSFRLATPAWSVLRHLHDKRLLRELALRLGIPQPAAWWPKSAAEVEELPVEFPAIVKPTSSVSLQRAYRKKALLARDRRELIAQYRRAREVAPAEGLLVQELIPGSGEEQYSVAAFCQEGEMLVAMTARRRRQYPFDFGLSSSFVEAVSKPELIPLAERLLAGTGVSGMLEVEFKRDPRSGEPKLLDVNVRPWGWHGLCIASGIDFPYMQYCWATGRPLPAAAPVYGRRWRRAITDIPAGFQEIRAGRTSLRAYLGSLGGGHAVPSVFDPADPLPAVGDSLVVVGRALTDLVARMNLALIGRRPVGGIGGVR
jgi:D-aspartate ligase